MGGHPIPEMLCTFCSKPIDLTVDLCADEKGKAIHESCYVNRLNTLDSIHHSIERFLRYLSAQRTALYCVKCNAPLLPVSATFFMEGGKSRTIPLPLCKNCNRPERERISAA